MSRAHRGCCRATTPVSQPSSATDPNIRFATTAANPISAAGAHGQGSSTAPDRPSLHRASDEADEADGVQRLVRTWTLRARSSPWTCRHRLHQRASAGTWTGEQPVRGEATVRARLTRGAAPSIFRGQIRRWIGNPQSKWPPHTRTQRPPHCHVRTHHLRVFWPAS
jgi:hypothetical protein